MSVMIFVTQNNFQNGPGISDRLLGFYPSEIGNRLTSSTTTTKSFSFDRFVSVLVFGGNDLKLASKSKRHENDEG